jgi:hypothetical protein
MGEHVGGSCSVVTPGSYEANTLILLDWTLGKYVLVFLKPVAAFLPGLR